MGVVHEENRYVIEQESWDLAKGAEGKTHVVGWSTVLTTSPKDPLGGDPPAHLSRFRGRRGCLPFSLTEDGGGCPDIQRDEGIGK